MMKYNFLAPGLISTLFAVNVSAGVPMYMCNEPLYITNCEQDYMNSPTCTFENSAKVPFPSYLTVYAYGRGGVELGSSLVFINGLEPGRQVRKAANLIYAKEAEKVVFCTVDPQDAMASYDVKSIY